MRAYLENGKWMPELTTAPRTDAYKAFVAIPVNTSACLDPSDNKIKMTCPAATTPVATAYYPYSGAAVLPIGMKAYLENGMWMPELATAPRTDAHEAFVAIPI
jgi:hypothetical protein